jgi:hypothetical protein
VPKVRAWRTARADEDMSTSVPGELIEDLAVVEPVAIATKPSGL